MELSRVGIEEIKERPRKSPSVDGMTNGSIFRSSKHLDALGGRQLLLLAERSSAFQRANQGPDLLFSRRWPQIYFQAGHLCFEVLWHAGFSSLGERCFAQRHRFHLCKGAFGCASQLPQILGQGWGVLASEARCGEQQDYSVEYFLHIGLFM